MKIMKGFLMILGLLLIFSCSETSDSNDSMDEKLAEEKTSPFSAVKFEEDKILVQVESEWFQFLKMDQLEANGLVQECKNIYNDGYKKRFSEDFVEFLHKIDQPASQKEIFTLLDAEGKIVQKELTFTKENRTASRDFYRKNYDSSKSIDPQKMLSKAQMQQDLDALADILDKHHSYLHLKGLDIEAELNGIRSNLTGTQTTLAFGTQLKKFINKLGDGHAGVERWDIKDMGLLPFETMAFEDKVICYSGQELLEEEYPFLVSINKIPVEKLLQSSREYFISDTSPHFVKAFSVRRLKRIGFLLDQYKALDKTVEVILANEYGKSIKKSFSIERPEEEASELIQAAKALLENSPISSETLEGNIGYLKIASMTSRNAKNEISEAMDELGQTEGIVIDVRNNGGGSRETLLELMPHFISPSHPPVVGNLGVYRTDEQDLPKEGVLRNRFMYPMSATGFTNTDKNLLNDFINSFEPRFAFDTKKFTDWHFLLIKSTTEKKFYDKPVVVLMNEGCFSATDIFLSAFNQLENVSLIGTKSGGGSGRTRKHTLPNSNWTLRLSSIISFQPHGELYEGNGVSPDIEVRPKTIDDLLGKTDTQLSFAIQHIQKKAQ